MEARPAEMRVLGCLIEKQRTTPDVYPLTLNALRAACNQATNRDPVVEYDEATIRDAIERLSRRRWARLASGQGSRAPKYRHLLADALGLGADELSVLAVLMLRGPQTPGELKARAERMHHFEDLAALEGTLERLGERGHVRRLERRPGQKEERFAQLLGGTEIASAVPDQYISADAGDAPPPPGGSETREAAWSESADPAGAVTAAAGSGEPGALAVRVERLEAEVAALRSALEELREELGA